MADTVLDALLAQADAEIERLTAVQEKRIRLQSVNEYIPQVLKRIKAFEPLVEQGTSNLLLTKMQATLTILQKEKVELEQAINPAPPVAVVAKEVRLGAPELARPSVPLPVEPTADTVTLVAVDDNALRRERKESRRVLSSTIAMAINKLRNPATHVAATEELREAIEQYLCVVEDGDVSELVDRIAEFSYVVASGPQFRDLRRALRNKGIKVEEQTAPVVEERITLEEKYRGSFIGKAGLILGGIAFPEAAKRIQDFFGFETLDWISGDKASQLAACCNRVASGKVAVAFALVKLCSHIAEDHLRKACRSNGTLYAMVRGGYSINNLIRSLEESAIKVTV